MTASSQSPQRSLEQKRAKNAWDCVQKVIETEKDPKQLSGFAQAARSAPVDIQVNGLGQTLSFWNSKKGKESLGYYAALLKALSAWLQTRPGLNQDDLLPWIITSANSQNYRRATVEAMAWLVWVKRFAEAEIKSDGGGTQNAHPTA